MNPASASREPRSGAGSPLLLRDVARRAYIACYREDVSRLLSLLVSEGIAAEEGRAVYSEEEVTWSASIRCLLTHRAIWRRIVANDEMSLVVESDFVPVQGFGGLGVPVGWVERPGFAWLYPTGPSFYRLDGTGAAIGDAGGTVAYLLDGRVANALLDFATELLDVHDPATYRGWDTEFRTYLRHGRGIPTYVPHRDYGEHGGAPNPEHFGRTRTPTSRSECLVGPLSFLPDYARGSRARFLAVRLKWKLRGLARLALGRTLPLSSYRNAVDPRLLRFAIGRLLTPY